jgi:hypothetical protein
MGTMNPSEGDSFRAEDALGRSGNRVRPFSEHTSGAECRGLGNFVNRRNVAVRDHEVSGGDAGQR